MPKLTHLIIGLIIIVVILLSILLFLETQDKNLQVIFFDVGQGDSCLIKSPQGEKILIDGGPDKTVIYKLGKYLPFYDRTIDLVILTHPHADHVTGLVEVLKRYKIRKILMTGVLHTAPSYLEFLKIIKEKNIPIKIAYARESLKLKSNLLMEILHPDQDLKEKKVDDLNDTSIVLKLIYQNTSFLLMGDASSKIEEKLLASKSGPGSDLKADILKVAHQGSSDATSEEFIIQVKPKYAIISVGKNRFGHPSLRVIRRLERESIKVLRTDQLGDIKIISDGESIKYKK